MFYRVQKMGHEILISRSSDVKIIEYSGSVYCLDPQKPNVLRVSGDVKQILLEGKGKSREELLGVFPDSAQAIDQVEGLMKQGFFQDSPPVPSMCNKPLSKISLAVSTACNFRCRYCYERYQEQDPLPVSMTQDIATRSVDCLAGHSEEIDFFGGEPLLNFKLIRAVVDYCRQKGKTCKYTITTNGSLVTPAIANFLAENGFTVVVSIDGPGPVHNGMRRFRNGKPTFDSVWKGIMLLMEAVPAARLVFTGVLTARHPYPEKLFEESKTLGLPCLALNTVSAPGKDGIDLNEVAIRRVMEGERAICEAMIQEDVTPPVAKYLPITQYMRFLAKGEARRSRCSAGIDNVAVGTDGKMYLCHRFLGHEAFCMGDAWNGIDEDRRTMFLPYDQSHGECSSCWARTVCGGPCKHDSFAYKGSLGELVPMKCERTRHLIELAVIAFGELLKQGGERVRSYL